MTELEWDVDTRLLLVVTRVSTRQTYATGTSTNFVFGFAIHGNNNVIVFALFTTRE